VRVITPAPAEPRAEAGADAEAELTPGELQPEGTSSTPYQLSLPSDLPASAIPDGADEHLASFGEAAASAGIAPKIAQRLVNELVQATYDVDYQGELNRDGAERFLRATWKQDYDRKMALVTRAVNQLGGNRLRDWLDQSGWGNSPAVCEVLARYGEGLLTMSKAEAEKKREAIMKDRTHPFWDQNLGGAERRRITAEVRLLNAIINEGGGSPKEALKASMRQQLQAQQEQYRTQRASAAPEKPEKPLSIHERKLAAQQGLKPGQQPGAATKGSAKEQAAAMLRDPKHPLNDRGHKDHAAAVKRWHDLVAKL
jgi:hypothetical protein